MPWTLVDEDGDNTTDGGDSTDGGDEADDANLPGLVVTNLRVLWATPNQIRWAWDTTGDEALFARYELVTATRSAEVLSAGSSTQLWTASDSPELGRFRLPPSGYSAPVLQTTTAGLSPNTTYFGMLRVWLADGERSETSIATGVTSEAPTNEIVIFSEADTPGYSLPSAFTRTTGAQYSGTYHYEYVSTCTNSNDTECRENLRRQNIGLSMSALGPQEFAAAYFEVAVSAEAPTVSWWSMLWLYFDSNCGTCQARYGGWTLVPGDYRIVQVPLSALDNGGAPLTHGDLAPGLFEFNVGGVWGDNARVRVDELRIRW